MLVYKRCKIIIHARVACRQCVEAVMVQYIRASCDNPAARTVPRAVKMLEKQFAATAKERAISPIGDILSLKRDASETVQQFWPKRGEELNNLDGSAVQLPDSLLVLRLLKGIRSDF